MSTQTEELADIVVAAVRAATSNLLAKQADLEAKILLLEARAPVPGPAGPQGPQGERGLDGLACPGARGEPGPPGEHGKDGKDAPPVDVDDLALRAAELIPKPKDGAAGKDGRDGQPGVPGVPGRDGASGERGEKGLDGKDGRDGTLDALRVEQIDERRWRFVRSDGTPMPGDPIYLPNMVYRGVFVEGTAYDKGDAVTFGGSLWVARETTKNKPGDGATAWQLAAKEGRRGLEGKPAKDGDRGPKGDKGDPGRNFS